MKEAGVPIDVVLEIQVDDDELVTRITGRRVHPGSGRVYVDYNPPQQEGLDDVTGEPLQQREDDTEATVRERLSVYAEQTQPLIAHTVEPNIRYIEIDGLGDVATIQNPLPVV